MQLEHCAHCARDVVPEPPATRWKVLLGAYWLGFLALVPLFGGIVGLSIVLVPALLAMALGLGAAARMATSWTCPDCHRELHRPDDLHDAYRVHRERMKARKRAEALSHA